MQFSLIFADDLAEEPPPPPPDVAQNDLMMRLSLLLGNRSVGKPLTPSNSQSSMGTHHSIDRIEEEGCMLDHSDRKKAVSDSPLSTLTGQYIFAGKKLTGWGLNDECFLVLASLTI